MPTDPVPPPDPMAKSTLRQNLRTLPPARFGTLPSGNTTPPKPLRAASPGGQAAHREPFSAEIRYCDPPRPNFPPASSDGGSVQFRLELTPAIPSATSTPVDRHVLQSLQAPPGGVEFPPVRSPSLACGRTLPPDRFGTLPSGNTTPPKPLRAAFPRGKAAHADTCSAAIRPFPASPLARRFQLTRGSQYPTRIPPATLAAPGVVTAQPRLEGAPR